MEKQFLNIVSFNIPYPPNYGGVIDIFYKLKALSENNVKIILHTFQYNREKTFELEQYCEEVYYYQRATGIQSQLTLLPYIVYSRKNEQLLSNLKSNNYPILFEGLHTCYYLDHPKLKDREKWVRIHNIEHFYYSGLVKNTSSFALKIYFRGEAMRLKWYEKQLKYADKLLALSTVEQNYYEQKFGTDKVIYIPLFTDNTIGMSEKDTSPTFDNPYVLYHGDLSNWENFNAACHLIKQYAAIDSSIQWIFAGLNPKEPLLELASHYPNVSILGNLSTDEMARLIREASVNILYTNQISGVKIKLINALRLGEYCLATKEMVAGSGLEDLCIILPDGANETIDIIKHCFQQKIPADTLIQRKKKIDSIYNNDANAKKVISLF